MPYATMSTSVPWSLVKSGFKKTPDYNTVKQKTAASRGDAAFSLKPYPTWNFNLDLNAVLGGEWVSGSVLQDFLGCFMACAGGAALFLFTDPNDNTVALSAGVALNVTPGAAQPMEQVGDGTSKVFQLARTIGQGVDILQNVTITTLMVGSSTMALGTDYSVDDTGVVTFVSAPAFNAIITWEGSFQYLCQFAEDTLAGLARVNVNSSGWLWECSSIKFESRFV